MKSGIIEYYDFRLSTKLKNVWNNGIEKLWEFKYIMLFFGFAIMIITAYYQYNVNALKENVLALEYKLADTERIYDDLELTLKYETEKREVDILRINQKVDVLHKFIKKIYPSYNYKSKIDKALYDSESIEDLPENLWNIYVYNRLIKPHGLDKYEKALPNTIFPIDEKSGYVAVKGGEFGTKRRYNKKYNYSHIGNDYKSLTNNAVYAVYDMIITEKYYTEASGWIIAGKFKYINEENESEWFYIRLMHLSDVNSYVAKGKKVKKGDVIATMDTTGYLSTGVHVHIEVYKHVNGKWRPFNFVKNSTWGNTVKRIL
jgi:murein DD-endopeptidase MepM/ murein hydrolase activator NlpD